MRIRGTVAEVSGVFLHGGGDAPLHPVVAFVGQCSASSPLRINVRVPDVEGYCAAGERSFTFQTQAVHHFTVGVGLGVFLGETSRFGVDLGAGGNPGTVFERSEMIGAVPLGFVLWHPFGTSDGLPALEQRIGVGAAFRISDPVGFSALLSIQIVNGIALFAGYEFLREEQVLGGGLRAGDVFGDDSSLLPASDQWTTPAQWESGFFVGVGGTFELVSEILGVL